MAPTADEAASSTVRCPADEVPQRRHPTPHGRAATALPGSASMRNGSAWVTEVVQGLSRLERGVEIALRLAYFGGHSQEQIAHRLKLPLAAVNARIAAGLRQLGEILTAAEPDPAVDLAARSSDQDHESIHQLGAG